jgi:hypothetical protein
LVEIERSLNYQTKLLILYRRENDKMPDSISSVTKTIPESGRAFIGYNDVNEITSIVRRWLPRFEEAGKSDD